MLKKYFMKIERFIKNAPEGKIIAIGKCGLDYDILETSDKKSQKDAFRAHFYLAQKYKLPMYFHSKSAS